MLLLYILYCGAIEYELTDLIIQFTAINGRLDK